VALNVYYNKPFLAFFNIIWLKEEVKGKNVVLGFGSLLGATVLNMAPGCGRGHKNWLNRFPAVGYYIKSLATVQNIFKGIVQ
jgi:hypothetical protein